MEVSVIIPVYNAVDYLDQAIRSAILQVEIREVIVIDDGSTDGSYERLQKWEVKEEKVQLLTHRGRKRKRAGAARNLGLRNANFEFVTFLDADDYFLPSRFFWTKKTFHQHPETDVVFEAIQLIKEEGSQLTLPKDRIIMMKPFPEKKAFETYLTGRHGYSPITGVTFKRKILKRVGYMDEELPQRQDKDFIYKLCLHGNVRLGIGGEYPVAIYRYHNTNTVSNIKESRMSDYQFYSKWVQNLGRLPVSLWGKLIFMQHYMVSKYQSYDWSKIKKAILYPFLYLKVILSNKHIFSYILFLLTWSYEL